MVIVMIFSAMRGSKPLRFLYSSSRTTSFTVYLDSFISLGDAREDISHLLPLSCIQLTA